MKKILFLLVMLFAISHKPSVFSESRTPISSLPHTITTEGSYYLTGNLIATGSTAGITISADNVTLDLNGFALIGGGSGSEAGINVPAAQQNISISNGTVRGWTNGGVVASNASNSFFEKLRLSNNTGVEPGLTVGPGSTVKDCIAAGNNLGIASGDNCTIISCTASGNSIHGFQLGNNVTVVDCTVSGNLGDGILVAAKSSVLHCNVSGNGRDGIDTGSSCTLTDCTVSGNSAGTGISVANGCSVSGNTVRGNSNGITMSGGCYVYNNILDVNTLAGIFVTGSNNRIEANNITFNSSGLEIVSSGAHNLVIRNSAYHNSSANYNIFAGNVVGTIVAAPLSGVVNGSTGGAGVGTTNPWANLSF